MTKEIKGWEVKIQETSRSLLEKLSLSEEDIEKITERGYILKREIGEDEGSTRRIYVGTRKEDNLEVEGVLKVPKPKESIVSINARMNRSRRNIDLQEALIAGKLKHNNIVRVNGSFQLTDGRTVNFEDKIDGLSLYSFLRQAGPMKDRQRLKNTFLPLISAVEYAHSYRDQETYNFGVLHRDITTRNIMIPQDGRGAVLTDWQNAAFERDIEELAMPTRGGTPYTHPVLLNALMSGTMAKATKRMDIYSLGATLFEAVTGEQAFNYSITEDETGKEISFKGETYRLRMKDGDQDITQITDKAHEATLKKALKKAPRRLRPLLYGMLTTDSKKNISDMTKVREEFEKATKPGLEENVETAWRYIKIGAATSVVTTGLGFGAYMAASLDWSSTHETTLSDVLRSQTAFREYSFGNLETVRSIKEGGIKDDFQKYIDEAEKRKVEITGEFDTNLGFVSRPPGWIVDKRLVSALMRSIILEDNNEKAKFSGRGSYILAPRKFIEDNLTIEKHDEAYFNRPEIQTMWMGRYIQGAYQHGDCLEDIYVKALCSLEEIDMAKAQTQQDSLMKDLRDKGFQGIGGSLVPIKEIANQNVTNITYFARPIETEINGLIKGKTTTIMRGYSERLNPVKKRIIDRAIALYTVTDKDGTLHLERYNQPIGTTQLADSKQGKNRGQN